MSSPKPNPDRKIVEHVDLDEPVKCYDQELERLEFEKPRAAALKIVETYPSGEKDYEQVKHLIMLLADVPAEVVDRLALADFRKCEELVHRFFTRPAK